MVYINNLEVERLFILEGLGADKKQNWKAVKGMFFATKPNIFIPEFDGIAIDVVTFFFVQCVGFC